MTPDEFRKLLKQLELSVYAAGPALGVSRGTCYLWARGVRPIPERTAKLLRLMADSAVK